MRSDHCAECGYLVEYHDAGKRCPGLKTKQWRERDPIDGALWREVLGRDVAARARALEEAKRPYVVITALEPVVAARPPYGPQEFAGAQGRQAVGLGRKAARCGMSVAPFYWKSGTNVEGCAVKGWRPTLAFVATWQRRPGKSWATDVAYAWNPADGRVPIRIPVTELLEMIR